MKNIRMGGGGVGCGGGGRSGGKCLIMDGSQENQIHWIISSLDLIILVKSSLNLKVSKFY